MCQLLHEDAVVMTKQGLDFRFTKEAVGFMKKRYDEPFILEIVWR